MWTLIFIGVFYSNGVVDNNHLTPKAPIVMPGFASEASCGFAAQSMGRQLFESYMFDDPKRRPRTMIAVNSACIEVR